MATLDPISVRNSNLFIETSTTVFDLVPHLWQVQVGTSILNAITRNESIKYLCVRPTGGGKSLVFNVVATIINGVTLCICPLLSLGADQTKKTLHLSEGRLHGRVTSFHLDELKPKCIRRLKNILIDPRNQTSVLLFASPQSLTESTIKNRHNMLPFLIKKQLIRLVVVDEIHLATHFGNTFRKEFGDLKSALFAKLNSNCPMIFLTATCTATIYSSFQELMNIKISSVHWPTPTEMLNRSVNIQATYTSKPFQHLMKTFKLLISDNPNLPSKIIVYSNTRSKIINFTESIKKKMDADAIMKNIDVITLVGTLTKQEKSSYIRKFVNGSKKHPQLQIKLLCATSGVGNAGIDCSDVRAVYRIEFPPSILDLVQEKGRAGRRPGATAENYHYIMCYSLETFLYVFKRIYQPKESFANESFRSILINDLLEVALLLVIPDVCFSAALEFTMGRPGSDLAYIPKCQMCSNCVQTKPTFEPVSKDGVKRILISLFLSTHEDMSYTMESVVKFIKEYENSQEILFQTKRKNFEPVRIKKLLFQLLSCRILTVVYSNKLETMVFELAKVGNTLTDIALSIDSFWKHIITSD